MSYEHTDLFKQLGDDLERWTKSVREWEKISTKSYTLDELSELEKTFCKTYPGSGPLSSSWESDEPTPKEFLEWLKERENK